VKATVEIVGGDALQKALQEYQTYSRKLPSEVLQKKGNDLRIQLFRLFREKRWAGGKTIAEREMRARAKEGKGTLTRRGLDISHTPTVSRTGKPLGLQSRRVAAEIATRQSGIGVLGVSFLLSRWSYSKSGRTLIQNRSRSLGILSEAELSLDASQPGQSTGTFRLTGYTPGMARVAAKYGILAKAKAAVLADMQPYLARKAAEAARKAKLR